MEQNEQLPRKRLLAASREGDIGAIRAALADGAQNLDEAVLEAVRRNQPQAAAYLLDSGAKLFRKASGYRAARHAASMGWTDMLALLLERGLDPNGHQGDLLRLAVIGGKIETVEFLIENGADPLVKGPVGRWNLVADALGTAARAWKLSATKALLATEAGRNVASLREALTHARASAVWVPGEPNYQELVIGLLEEALAAAENGEAPDTPSKAARPRRRLDPSIPGASLIEDAINKGGPEALERLLRERPRAISDEALRHARESLPLFVHSHWRWRVAGFLRREEYRRRPPAPPEWGSLFLALAALCLIVVLGTLSLLFVGLCLRWLAGLLI